MKIDRRNFLRVTGLGGIAFAAMGRVSFAEDGIPSTLNVGMSNQLPYAFLDEAGVLTGQSPDVLRAALKDAGVEKVEGTLTEFGALIPGLIAKRFDIICTGLFIRPQRCELIAYGNPDSISREGLVVPAGNPNGLKSLADIAKSDSLTIGFVRGSVDEAYVTEAGIPDSRWVVLPDVPTLIAALKGGRADAVISSLVILAATLDTMKDDAVELVEGFVDPTQDGKPAVDYAAMGFRKEDTALVDAYNKGLAKLVASGEIVEINKKWGLPAALSPTADTPTSDVLCKA
ncbi:MAG: ectoine/hydroxyectoine ABC transporter substrate-binding protein EhuB [Bauldia sp.]|nr:ectoine/hydroxyectoine ABC transporter substrate-binding protein EhuB [Bauldia sp.]